MALWTRFGCPTCRVTGQKTMNSAQFGRALSSDLVSMKPGGVLKMGWYLSCSAKRVGYSALLNMEGLALVLLWGGVGVFP